MLNKMEFIPSEVISYILSYLSYQEMFSLFSTNRRMKHFDNDYNWKQLLIKEYDSVPPVNQEKTLKELYFSYKHLEKVCSVNLYRSYFVYREAYKQCTTDNIHYEMMKNNLLCRDPYLKIQVALKVGITVYIPTQDFSLFELRLLKFFDNKIHDIFDNNTVIEFGFRKNKKILFLYLDLASGITISFIITEQEALQIIKCFYVSNFRILDM